MVTMVEIRDLTHVYNAKQKALDNVSFNVKKGEVLGLLGPNGAGKSTIVKIITGILKPTSGCVKIDGLEVTSNLNVVRRKLGFLPQETALYQDLTAKETLEYHADLYGVPKDMVDKKIADMLELAGLVDRKNDLVKTYSGGMKRRLGLVRAILHDAELLILDEMSIGVDVQSRSLIWKQVKQLKNAGVTIVFCTNYMDEAENIADRLIVLDHGKIVAQGTPGELKQQYVGEYLIEANLEGITKKHDKHWLSTRIGLEVESLQGTDDDTVKKIQIKSKSGYTDLPNVITKLSESGFNVKYAAMREPSLGDVFLTITGSKLRD